MGPFDPENKITVSPADLAQLIILSLVFHQFREEEKNPNGRSYFIFITFSIIAQAGKKCDRYPA